MMRKRSLFWGIFLLIPLSLLSLALTKINFSNYDWLPEDNPIQEAKRYLDTEFQHGEDLVIVIRPALAYFSPQVLTELHEIYEALHKVTYVKSVNSPLHAQLAIENHEDALSITSYHSALEQGLLEDIDAYRQHLIGSDYWGQLIAKDVNSFLIIVKLDIRHGEIGYEKRDTVVTAASNLLTASRWLQDHQFAGETELIYQLDKKSKNNLSRLLPIVAGITFIILWLVLRSLMKAVLIMLAAFFTLLISFNITVYNGHPFSVVSLSLPILIIVIAIADSIHIVARWERLKNIRNPWARIKQTTRQIWFPCLVTSITTAVGFGVFYFSELIPLSHFGMDAFISILLAYPTMLLLTLGSLYVLNPWLIQDEEKDQKQKELCHESFISHWTQWLQKFPAVTIIIILLITAPVIYQLSKAHTETNFLDAFFPKKSPIYQAFTFIDEELSGSGAIDIILQGEAGRFQQLKELEKVRSLTSQLLRLNHINVANSYLLPLALVHKEFSDGKEKYPQTQEQLAQEFLFLEFSRSDTENDVLSPYIDFDYANTRIHIQTPNLSSVEVKKLLAEVSPLLMQMGIQGALITGMNYYFQSLSDYVVGTQLHSFILCLILVWLFFVIRFGGVLGTIALFTNLLPLGFTLGLIPLLNLPFDFATVLVASISLGLCIDNTIHYLHYCKLCRQGREHIKTSLLIPQVSETLARPIFLTSFLLIIGFSVFIFADLILLTRFGLFSAVAIFTALLSVFVFLPCALTLVDKMSKRYA